MPLINIGKKAPAFTLNDQANTPHALADYAGKVVVLYFYPKDDTSGCTAQACQFEESLAQFQSVNAVVLGVSILNTKSKAKFATKHDLSFPLLADDAIGDDNKPDPEVAEKYGAWILKSMYGKTYMGIQRTTYLIGEDGTVIARWDKVKVPGHVEEVIKELEKVIS